MQTLFWLSATMGNSPLDWAAPNGYPDVASAWRSSGSLLAQWRIHLGLTDGWWKGFRDVPAASLYGRRRPRTSGEAVAIMTHRITGMTFSAEHRRILQRFLDEPASTPMADSRLRWLAAPLAALVLDSPHHALR